MLVEKLLALHKNGYAVSLDTFTELDGLTLRFERSGLKVKGVIFWKDIYNRNYAETPDAFLEEAIDRLKAFHEEKERSYEH